MTRQKKKWNDLSPLQQKALIAAAAVEVVLTGVALRDLARRPASQVRGRKWQWVLGCAVQPFGPVSYLVAGRK